MRGIRRSVVQALAVSILLTAELLAQVSDLTRAWVLGGGVRFPLPRRLSQLSLDFGVRYHRGGEASYLREGSILDQPDGSILVTPLNSRTSHVVYLIGLRFRIPYNSTKPCPRFLC